MYAIFNSKCFFNVALATVCAHYYVGGFLVFIAKPRLLSELKYIHKENILKFSEESGNSRLQTFFVFLKDTASVLKPH